MDHFRIRQLLKRYLEGNTSLSEKRTVDNWYHSLDEEAPVSLDRVKEDSIREEIWQTMQPALGNQPARIRKIGTFWLKVAAAVLIIGSFSPFLWKSAHKEHATTSTSVAYTEISTKTGERKRITLPDGSLLTLNSATIVRIMNDFSLNRNVRIIDGEVYFDVKHDASHLFTVQSGPLTTNVLGTAFNIRAYSQLNKMAVGVTRGMVSVAIAGKPLNLLPKGQQLVFEKRQTIIHLMPLDRQVLSWQQGNLVLNDASFEEMAILVNKNYGVFVSCTDPAITSKHFTATLPASMSPVKAMEVIAAIYQLKLKQRRDIIEIYE